MRCVDAWASIVSRWPAKALSRGLTPQKLDDELFCYQPCVKAINLVWRIVWEDYPEL
jgi:hypothetical protein